MINNKKIKDLLDILSKENIQTWFDLGLFLDRIKENNEITKRGKNEDFSNYEQGIRKGGVAFITFHYMVDGVTVETGKYASVFEKNYPGIPIHYVGGSFNGKSEALIKGDYLKHTIPELAGFDEWPLYKTMFGTELERGSKEYNDLIKELWSQTLVIIEKLGSYIFEKEINLLYVINMCSNPGNVAAALALVLLSEYFELQLINNNHDFYFEGGNSKFDKQTRKLKKGPRDHFFTNAHLGEIFSLIEMIFPWDSQYWLNVNINLTQSEYLIRKKGHNPARIMEIGTAVDTEVYKNNDKRRNINALLQMEKILARYKKQLICYSAEDVEKGGLVSEEKARPILIGNKTRAIRGFSTENIIFLQPTRIISRKRIELGFDLLLKIFENEEMRTRFQSTKNLKITLLISGPIASGHHSYYKKIVDHFRLLLDQIPFEYRDRVFLGLLLGEIDKQAFLEKFERPMGIPDLYNIASLILLPSKTEGRGLPIIEATACGTPIFCRRYEPEEVYAEVIGEHLGERDRLKVYEFRGKKISRRIVENIIERVFFPHKFADQTKHNKRIVEKRYSLKALEDNIVRIVSKSHTQAQKKIKERESARTALKEYAKMLTFRNEDFDFLIKQKNRHYLPGYGRLSFMLMLKSLIDPSFFRVEQQKVRGNVYYFASELLRSDPYFEFLEKEKIDTFFNSVEKIFQIVEGEVSVRHDHSMSYRHRNKNLYPYQKYTFQELTGLVNMLYFSMIQQPAKRKTELSPQFFTDWNLALLQLSTSKYLAIDNRDTLIRKLKTNCPIAYFPGEFFMYELEFFALQSIRSRLGLPIEEELTEERLIEFKESIAPVYIFAQEKNLGKQLNKAEIINYIETGSSEELKLLYNFKIIRIISTRQLCVGIHFTQLGEEPLKIIRKIREECGFLLTNRRHASLMTDIVNIDRCHIGKVRGESAASTMGIPIDSGYIQYVPAGLRACLAYPTPVQTAKDFDQALHSKEYALAAKKLGEEELLRILQEDAENQGTPIMNQLQSIIKNDKTPKPVRYSYISGVYEDGNPYNGAICNINLHKDDWSFSAVSAKNNPRTVSDFVNEFEEQSGQKSQLAWNGGYILNPELVGKLGLPESYIGSPLGLLITEGTCKCPPLFNKPALLFDRKGKAEIRRVNCSKGLSLKGRSWSLSFSEKNYNPEDPKNAPAYYDLMYPKKDIVGDGRTILRLSGRTIKEVIKTKRGERIKIIPVGITLSFSKQDTPGGLAPEQDLEITLPGFDNILHAIEAGPLLLDKGKNAINMEKEGWKTANSISTQAARLDYLDMRGPKIAVGLNAEGEMLVLTVNGRIRESVGASHFDMANILQEKGMMQAMGFDPGGSSTLFVDGHNLNVSPYNKDYEYSIYAMPPQARAVSNAVIGYLSKK